VSGTDEAHPDRPDGPVAAHYFDPVPTTGSAPSTVELHLPDVSLRLATDTGVFSGSSVDVGTKILLADSPPVRSGSRTIVDVGCGYGPIALTLAKRAPEATIWAVDVNRRARELCTANAVAAGVANVTVIAPEDFPDDLVIDEIWSNPPIRIGKPALHELLTAWLDRLGDDGVARFVVQKHLGADSLSSWLEAQGWPTTRLSSKRTYRLLEVTARGLTRTD